MTHQDILDIKSATYKMCRTSANALLSAVLIGLAGSVLLITQADAATLKSSAVVNDDVVTIGDIFEGAEKPETVLGASPALGKDMLLNARVLKRIATNYSIAWLPLTSNDQITVRRDAHTIDENTISDTLKTALMEKGVDGNFNLTLTNAAAGIILPGNVDATVEVADLNYTAGRDVFTATLASPSADNPLKTLQVSGLINRMVSVPSLTGTARKGDIISASDIAWIEVPERNVSKDVLLDADELIGKTPSKILTSKRPIKGGEVANPQLVSRGDEITILYNVSGMTLSAKGKSQQNGTEGDLIRVTNLSSAKSMAAQVTGDRTVTVQ